MSSITMEEDRFAQRGPGFGLAALLGALALLAIGLFGPAPARRAAPER
jgi:hypothetical protein